MCGLLPYLIMLTFTPLPYQFRERSCSTPLARYRVAKRSRREATSCLVVADVLKDHSLQFAGLASPIVDQSLKRDVVTRHRVHAARMVSSGLGSDGLGNLHRQNREGHYASDLDSFLKGTTSPDVPELMASTIDPTRSVA